MIGTTAPLVSLILATRNRRERARIVIDAVLRDKEEFPSLELIVIDGDSTDGTKEMLASYGGKIDRWMSLPGGGPYGAWAAGVPLANGRYIRVLSDDDVYCTGQLPSLAPFLEQGSVDIVAGSSCLALLSGPRPSRRAWWKSYSAISLDSFLWWPIWSGFAHESIFYSTDLFRRYGTWDLRYRIAADVEIVARFLSKGATMVKRPEVVLHRVNHPDALSVRHRFLGRVEVWMIMIRRKKYLHVVQHFAASAAWGCIGHFFSFMGSHKR